MNYCYGWPCGGTVDYPEDQVYQDRSWGKYLAFDLEKLDAGFLVIWDSINCNILQTQPHPMSLIPSIL